MDVYGFIMWDMPLKEDEEEICSVCGLEDWYCDECFEEIISIGDN